MTVLSAAGLGGLILPPLPFASTVTIVADHDAVGLAAAHKAAEHWHREGRMVRIARPAEVDADFNDLQLAAATDRLAHLTVASGGSR